jgi:hypothetical protein
LKEIDLLAQCSCPACIEWKHVEKRIADLANSYLARAAHNAFVILQEARTAVKTGAG